jgi:hypothetical protein
MTTHPPGDASGMKDVSGRYRFFRMSTFILKDAVMSMTDQDMSTSFRDRYNGKAAGQNSLEPAASH